MSEENDKPKLYDKECVKRAIKKYYEKNKDKIKDYARVYVKDRYHNDEEYRKQRLEYSRKYYQDRKKMISELSHSTPSVATMG